MSRKYFSISLALVLYTSVCFAQNWDIDLLKDINLHRNHSLDAIFEIVTNFAAPFAYCIPFLLLFTSLYKRNAVLKSKSIYLIQSGLTALAISTLLKYIIHRPRPFITYPFIEKLTAGGSASFPSGHTSDAFTLASSLSFAFPKWYIILPSYAWAIAVGYSRMDLGVHYPSDVFASILIGIGSSFFCYKIKARQEKRMLKKESGENLS